MKALCIIISSVVTFSPLGQQKVNYNAAIEKMSMHDCEIVKKSVSKENHVICVKESK